MKSKSVVVVRLAVGLTASVAVLSSLASLAGCYASEKIGKDIQDVSHDVNQGGIYMHRGALSVYRPERHPQPAALQNASVTAPATTATAAAPATPDVAPAPAPEWQPPADGSDELPKKEAAPPAAPPPAPAADAGVYSM